MENPQRSLIKRSRTSLTYEIPIRPHKSRYLRELADKENLLLPRMKLLSSPPNTELSEGAGNWGHEEVKALVMFILFHCKDDSWQAGKFFKMKSGSPHQRSGGAFSLYTVPNKYI